MWRISPFREPEDPLSWRVSGPLPDSANTGAPDERLLFASMIELVSLGSNGTGEMLARGY